MFYITDYIIPLTDIYRDVDSDDFPLPEGLTRIGRRLSTPDVRHAASDAVAEEIYEQ